MSSVEAEGKSKLRIGGAFGTSTREFFGVEYKEGQIVGYYNCDNNPKHFTKHGDGVLHEKSDLDGRTLWERIGSPLNELTGSESLGTYSYTVGAQDQLPVLKPGRNDTTIVFPAQEGMRVDVVVVAIPKSPAPKLLQQVNSQLSGEGLSIYGDAKRGLVVGIRQRKT